MFSLLQKSNYFFVLNNKPQFFIWLWLHSDSGWRVNFSGNDAKQGSTFISTTAKTLKQRPIVQVTALHAQYTSTISHPTRFHHFPWPERKYANLHQCSKPLANIARMILHPSTKCDKHKSWDISSILTSEIPPLLILPPPPPQAAEWAEWACVCSLLTKAITQRFVHTAECAVHHHHHHLHTLIKSPSPLSRRNKPYEAS